MAIANLIARGIGFSPGAVKYIVTHGLSIGEAVVVATPAGRPVRRRYIFPDGTQRYLTPREASEEVRRWNARAEPEPEKVREAIEDALEDDDEAILIGGASLFDILDLPSIPNIVFDFTPPQPDNAAIEMALLRTLAAQQELDRQWAETYRRREREAALLVLLLA